VNIISRKYILYIILIFFIFLSACSGSSESTGLLTDDFLKYENKEPDTPTPVVLSPASITGRVIDFRTLSPVPGAKVNLEGIITTYTDNNGNFTINNITFSSSDTSNTSITKKITVTALSYVSISEDITVSAGSNIAADFRLDRKTGVTSGLVILNTISVQGARVLIGDTEGTTNINGYFSIDNIPVGSQPLKVYIGTVLRLSTLYEVKEGANDLNINLDENSGDLVEISQLKGNIKDSKTGALLPDKLVTISGFPSVISGQSSSGDTGSESIKGFYILKNIPAGERVVTVVDPENKYFDFSQTVNLDPGENILDIQIIPKASAVNEMSNILGIVYDQDKNFVPGVFVRLRIFDELFNDYQMFEVMSQDDGWYNFTNIPQGNYLMTVIDPNIPKVYNDYFDDKVMLDDNTLIKNISLTTIGAP
jgi:hypothetical protein